MKKGFHVTPCIMWQVRSQLSGWCNLAIFIGCGAQLVHEGSSPAKVATWCPTKKTRINDVAIATATSSRGRMGWYLDG
jgi:hypothetical protein